jgi:hypothetical protein
MTAPQSTPLPTRVVVDVTIAAPIDDVWRALRDPARLAQWFGWDYDKLAEEIDVIFLAGGVETEPGRVLDMGGNVFELTAQGSATRVRMLRADAPASDTWDGIFDDVDEGWTTFVHQLAFYLEAQRGVDRGASPRRTFYAAGHRETAESPDLAAAAGLAGVATQAVGTRYAAVASTGEAIEGTVRFRTAHQLGLSVDGWGPGLLVLAGRPGSPKSPHGGGFALLTLFGQSEADVAARAEAWAAAWRRAFTRVSVMP